MEVEFCGAENCGNKSNSEIVPEGGKFNNTIEISRKPNNMEVKTEKSISDSVSGSHTSSLCGEFDVNTKQKLVKVDISITPASVETQNTGIPEPNNSELEHDNKLNTVIQGNKQAEKDDDAKMERSYILKEASTPSYNDCGDASLEQNAPEFFPKKKLKKKKNERFSGVADSRLKESSENRKGLKNEKNKINEEKLNAEADENIDLEFEGKKKLRRRRRENSSVQKEEEVEADNSTRQHLEEEGSTKQNVTTQKYKICDNTNSPPEDTTIGLESAENETDSLDFLNMKKKKATKRNTILYDMELAGKDGDSKEETDYTYDKLLSLVYKKIKVNNPEITPGETKKLKMPLVQVLLNGVRKTGLYNFMEICRALHRQPKHVYDYLLMEFATSGSIDLRNKLTLIGRFTQSQVQAVLCRYIREYVECRTCKSTDTMLMRSNRMQFLVCESCNSRYTVCQIKGGFRAVTRRIVPRR